MIEMIVALMIVGLFTVWVYNLKQEVETLSKRLSREVHHEHDQETQAFVVPAALHTRSNNGVQTWLLE